MPVALPQPPPALAEATTAQCHSKVTGQETCFEVSLLPLAAVGSGELSSSQGLSSAA